MPLQESAELTEAEMAVSRAEQAIVVLLAEPFPVVTDEKTVVAWHAAHERRSARLHALVDGRAEALANLRRFVLSGDA